MALADGGLMALAGLWENWRSPASEWVRSFAIITTRPNELCAELHDRMPVVLKPDGWPVWRGTRGPAPAQGPSGSLPIGRNDMLAGESARWQRQEQ